jgi:hypothetical protein
MLPLLRQKGAELSRVGKTRYEFDALELRGGWGAAVRGGAAQETRTAGL